MAPTTHRKQEPNGIPARFPMVDHDVIERAAALRPTIVPKQYTLAEAAKRFERESEATQTS